MFTWIVKPTAPARAGIPSPLLTHIAPEFAGRIAALWPAPHAVFLTAAAERRHLLCLALSRAEIDCDLADGLLHWPLRRALKVILPAGPDGLARALARLGETAWTAQDYGRLIDALKEPAAAKIVRHAETVTPTLVQGLAGAPGQLLRAGFGRLNLKGEQAEVVNEAWNIALRQAGPSAAGRLAERWSGAQSLPTLLERIREDLLPEVAPCPLPPHPRLRHLSTKAKMREAACRFENCLVDEMPDACAGTSVYYEWLGEPGAVIELTRDLLRGWVLDEARLKNNEAVTHDTRAAIVEVMTEMGVHVGRNAWDLAAALRNALVDDRPVRSVADLVGFIFGD